MARKRFRCECGQSIDYPYPQKCPKCGAEFVGINTRGKPVILQIVSIIFMFGTLVFLIYWLAQRN